MAWVVVALEFPYLTYNPALSIIDPRNMKTKPPTFRSVTRMTVAEKIEDLSIIGEIDQMLLDGINCKDVTNFIQLGLEELTDVKPMVLQKELRLRRARLRKKAEESESELGSDQVMFDERPAAVIPNEGRAPVVLAHNRYMKITKGMDRLIELEALYLAQRDRLDSLVRKEKELGFPFEITGREFLVAAKFLELHGKEERALQALDSGLSNDMLDIRGYSEETAEVLSKPDSRRRVISIVERLKRLKGGKGIPEASGE